MIFEDQISHRFSLETTPKTIISLVPSQTELLFDLGLEEKIIGITKFCVHPRNLLKEKVKVGGTKNLNMSRILDLNPDLIIANKEENSKEQIEKLQELFPIYTSDVKNLEGAISMIKDIGTIMKTKGEADKIIFGIEKQFQKLDIVKKKCFKTVYLIWKDPLMSVGNNTFINDMMERCGFQNIFRNTNDYPEVSSSEIKDINPELIFLSTEPYPFGIKDVMSFQRYYKDSRVVIVDGEFFSWYGSRLKLAVDYFLDLINEHS